MTKVINWCCLECGKQAHNLSHLVHFTMKSKNIGSDAPYESGICDACGNLKKVTNPKHFNNPDFTLLPPNL